MPKSIAKTLSSVRGRFIVLDGLDGSGKSSHHRRLESELVAAGLSVASCRDPGGTAIGDRIRSVLLDYDLSEMDVNCEAMLFMASRAQLVTEVIRPALAAGKTVLCDRFVSSTCAYQGAAGYDPRRVIELARFAIGDCWPHVTVLLDIDPEIGFQRIGRKPHHSGKNRRKAAGESTLIEGTGTDAMEARPIEFHRRVRRIFQEIRAYYPTPVISVDASADAETVYQRILEGLSRVAV